MSDDHAHHEDGHAHAAPMSALVATFVALLVLTVITVAASWAQLGEIALLVAMIVATVKATIVCMFFMHLWWDSKFNSLVLAAAFAFVALFLGLAILDTAEYKTNVDQYKDAEGVPQSRLVAPATSDRLS